MAIQRPTQSDEFRWSQKMDSVFEALVSRKVLEDERTWDDAGSLHPLGFPFEVVREDIIQLGLADFRAGYHHPEYGDLTADECALLYCFVNAKKHFFAAKATMEQNAARLARLASGKSRLVVVDFGCGPSTALWALAEQSPGVCVHYHGIDAAGPMRRLARAFWRSLRRQSLLAPDSRATYRTTWGVDVLRQLAPATRMILLFSYFFASHSLNDASIRTLANFVQILQKDPRVRSIISIHTNTVIEDFNQNYRLFKRAVGLSSPSHQLPTRTIRYAKRWYRPADAIESFSYEVIPLKGG